MNTFPMYPGSVKPMSPPTALTPGTPFVPFVPPMKAMTNSMPIPSQGTLVAPSASAQPTKEQIIPVYVGKIPPGVEDEFVRKLLEYCGKVTQWKRMSDPKTGKLKPFGLCDYDNPLSLVRAMRILNGLKVMGSELLLKVEDKTQRQLDAFSIQRKAMVAAARAVSNANKTESTEAKDADEETILDMKAYILALVSRRERNLDWKHVDISVVLQEAKVIRENLSQSSVNGDTSKPKIVDQKKPEQKNDEVEDKEKREKQEKVEKEREQRRKEREEKEFREREKLWEQWEKDREYRREKDREREKRQQNRAALDLQYDDNERKKRTSDYYQKKRIRDRERQDDFFESQREKEEKDSQAAKRLKEKEDKKSQDNRDVLKIVASPSPFTSSSVLSPSSPSPSATPSPGPVAAPVATSFNSGVRVVVPITLNPKKTLVIQEEDQHQESDDIFSKKKRKLATLDVGIQKRHQLDTLISQIPTESGKLMDYPIDWNAVQKFNIIDQKMVPWVTKKVEEYLGNEQSFAEHILKQLHSKISPREFLKQMQTVLEDDAEGFCVKLYRKLIFEQLHATASDVSNNN